jgi:hypothetical protein
MKQMALTGSKLRERARLLFGIDLRSLALFRITAATLLLLDLADRARLLGVNYTDAGAHPRAAVLTYHQPGVLPSLHLLAGSARAQLALFVLAGIAAALLAVGWRTWIATFVSWFLLGSLHARNELVLDGGDHLLRHLLFWCLFLPLGARWSLDARRRGAAPARSVVFSPASAALLLQVVAVFLVTGLAKTGPEWTTDGTAIRYAIDRRWWTLPFGEWLLAHPFLPELLTPAVRWWEILGSLFLFLPVATVPLRLLGIAGFWSMLAGLGLGLKLNLFTFIAGSGLLVFLPPSGWDALGRRFAAFRRHTDAAIAPPGGWRRVAVGLGHGAVLALLLLLVVWMNARTLGAVAPPGPLARVASLLRIEQGWLMYAPSPRHVDVWLEHRGRLVNGFSVNLDRATGGTGWVQVERAWQDYRFMYFLQKLATPRWQGALRAYADWLCRQWNEDRKGGARLELVRVTPVVEPIAIRDEPQQPPTMDPATTVLCPR